MARISLFCGLIKALILLSWAVIAVNIPDIFTVQGGTTNGGCDARMAALDDWLTECSYSLATAILAIQRADKDIKIRSSMQNFFGINSNVRTGQAARTAIKEELQYVLDFFNHNQFPGGGYKYNRDDFWLFCDSTFLTQRQPSDHALDFQGNDIRDNNNQPVIIDNVQPYKDALAVNANAKPWWAGDHTPFNAYVFDNEGGNFCPASTVDKGCTNFVHPLVPGPKGTAQVTREIYSIILCPLAFTDARPESYRLANAGIVDGTNFATTVPRSATLLHEAFHAIRGGDFLSAGDEEYDLAQAIELASKNKAKAQRNPENYVFFVAHMYHLYGTNQGNYPESISRNWDFRVNTGGNRQLVAVPPRAP